MALEPINPAETDRAIHLWAVVRRPGRTKLAKLVRSFPSEQANDEFLLAVAAADRALRETRRYLRLRREGGERDQKTENRLSELWSEASYKILYYDPDFANLCRVKGHGWADPTVWTDPRYKDEPTGLEEMYDRLKNFSKHRPQQKLEQYLAYTFGLVFIVVILILAIVFPEPTQFQYTVFRIVLALAAAGIAAVIPGFLNVQFRSLLRASGAIAVFVIVYFFSPAQLAIQQMPVVTSTTAIPTPSPVTPTPLPSSTKSTPAREPTRHSGQSKPTIIQERLERPSPEVEP